MSVVRYFYRRENSGGVSRVFTVAYTYDRATNQATYGASVFRQDQPSESFVKAHHRHTADQRRLKCPVNLQIPDGSWAQIEDSIRDSIRSYGVKGNRQTI
jgi:hypothetical protein